MSTDVHIKLPLRLESLANEHAHWRTRQRRTKKQRGVIGLALNTKGAPPPLPVVVELTNRRPMRLDDDNLVSAFKSVRDEVAQWLGVDDRSQLIGWVYAQTGGAHEIAIRVRHVPLVPEESIIVRRRAA